MAPREVQALRARLAAIIEAAHGIAAQAEDLHALAYDRPAGDEVKVAGGFPTSAYLDIVGNQQARKLWRRLEKELEPVEDALVAHARAAGNVLSKGPSAPATRGSKVSPGEFARAVLRQRQRSDAGEYTPHRTEDQPKYPGGKT